MWLRDEFKAFALKGNATEPAPEGPVAVAEDVVLLREIRDLLKSR